MYVLRAHVVAAMLRLVGRPYIWAAKGEVVLQPDGTRHPLPPGVEAYDCSGAVGSALLKAGAADLRFIWNTDTYWNTLPAVAVPQPGDVALYGGTLPNDVSHIEMVVTTVDSMIVVCGASGGDRTTTSVEDALKRRAGVSAKSTHLHRRDFRGFRSINSLLGQGVPT